MKYRVPLQFFSALICFSDLNALPVGFKAISGGAEIAAESSLHELLVENSGKSIVEWTDFSIGKGEIVRFLQSADSAILNRVIGTSESAILGLLQSGGKVYLINPNGVLIGPDSRIETAGFLASTLDVLDAEFLQSKEMLFSGESSAGIVNLGTIQCPAGDIVLLARYVKNEGNLIAKNGVASIGAAPEVLLQIEGDNRIFIRPDLKAIEMREGPFSLEQKGAIEAAIVELKSGGNPYLQAINCGGAVKAVSITEEGGKIYIAAEQGKAQISGELVANQGELGGAVHVLGDTVVLQSGTLINTDGANGGGEILIGGSYQGKDPSIKNAQVSFVDENVHLRANALIEGDGGQVVIWSENKTGFYGNISAEGGIEGGNGGLVEVSGPWLHYKGLSSTMAVKGNIGTLLLDPNDITISNAATNPAAAFPVGHEVYFDGYPPGDPAPNLDVVDLTAALNTNNVLIQTDDTQAGNGSVTIQNEFTWNLSTQLTIRASANIIISSGITIQNNSGGTPFTAIYFIANQANFLQALSPYGIRLENGASIITNDGDVFLQGTGGDTNIDTNVGIFLENSSITTGNGSITLIGQSSFTNTSAVGNIGVFLNGATITSGGDLLIDGNAFISDMPNGDSNQGVVIEQNSIINLSSIGDFTINGKGGYGDSQDYGILMNNSTVNMGPGNLNWYGESIGNQSQNTGIWIQSSTIDSVMAGPIDTNPTMFFQGISQVMPAAGNQNRGISVQVSNITSTYHNVQMVGYGAPQGVNSFNNEGLLLFGSSINLSAGGVPFNNISLQGFGGGGMGLAGNTNAGVVIQGPPVMNPTNLSTNVGDIYIQGAAFSPSSPGILISTDVIVSVEEGNIILSGIAEGFDQSNIGIHLINSSLGITGFNEGVISLTGIGSKDPGASNQNIGVFLEQTDPLINNTISSMNQDILINGIGGGDNVAGTDNCGIQFSGEIVVISNGTGSILLDGQGPTGTVGGSGNHGINFTLGDVGIPTQLTTAQGDISLTGIGGSGSNSSSHGISIDGVSTITSPSGNISFYGEGLGSGDSNIGISMVDSTIESTGSGKGNIVLTGVGSKVGASGNQGISLRTVVSSNLIRTSQYDISMIGIGGGTGVDNMGIRVQGQSQIQSTDATSSAGTITLSGTGASSTSTNKGIEFNGNGVVLTSSAGPVRFTGVGQGTMDSNVGIAILAGATIGTGSAPITFSGTGAAGTTLNDGIDINASTVSSTSGAINFTGVGQGTGASNIGILISNAGSVTTSASSSITFMGTGGAGTNSNSGISLSGATSRITGLTGPVTLTGIGRGSGTNNYGLSLSAGAAVTSSSAAITFSGTGAAGTISNSGIDINASTVSSASGAINFTGVGQGSGASNIGISISNAGNVTTSLSSPITFMGTGGAGTNSNSGISLSGATSRITGLTGPVTLTGIGQGSGTNNYGLSLSAGAAVTTTSAPIRFSGTAAAGTTLNSGIDINASTVSSATGAINFIGLGQGTGASNIGISISNAGNVTTSLSSPITFMGIGSTGTNLNSGISLTGATTSITGLTGPVTLTGIGQGSGTSNYGLSLSSGAAISSSTAPITIFGLAGPSNTSNGGVFLDGTNTAINTQTGSVFITTSGFGGSGGDLLLQNTGTINASMIGSTVDLNIFGDTSLLQGGQILGRSGITFDGGGDVSIDSTGGNNAGTIFSQSGSVTMDIGGNLTLLGGAVSASSASIATVDNPLTITVEGSISLAGTLGGGALTQIGGTTGSGNIIFPFIGGNVTLSGNSYSAIGRGLPTGAAQTVSGDITFRYIGSAVSLTGSANAVGFAQIGHIASAASGSLAMGGNIYINALGQVSLQGGTVVNNYAQIGHGSPIGGTSSSSVAGAVNVFAGTNIAMVGNTAGAYIVNPSANNSATFPHSGSITLVTDNANPLQAYIGAVGFSMDSQSFITNNQASSGGQVRIYTAQRLQNGIAAGQLINGAAFDPSQPVGFNTNYEQYDLYYGAGHYTGPEFVVYYKIPDVLNPDCPTCPTLVCPSHADVFFPDFYFLTLADVQLGLLLPVLVADDYHGHVCYWNSKTELWNPDLPKCSNNTYPNCWNCGPGFRRFESFVFENRLDRVAIRGNF